MERARPSRKGGMETRTVSSVPQQATRLAPGVDLAEWGECTAELFKSGDEREALAEALLRVIDALGPKSTSASSLLTVYHTRSGRSASGSTRRASSFRRPTTPLS